MALPKLSYPTFEVTIPSTNKTIKMRPFLVREEKILLVAQQTEEPKEVVNAIKQVIVNCSIDQFKDRKSTRLNSSHPSRSRMPSSA